MDDHSHRFVEEYEGLVGFGLDRDTDANTLTYYLQKFADDDLMAVMRERMSGEDMEELVGLMGPFVVKVHADRFKELMVLHGKRSKKKARE